MGEAELSAQNKYKTRQYSMPSTEVDRKWELRGRKFSADPTYLSSAYVYDMRQGQPTATKCSVF